MPAHTLPTKIGVLIFPGFQLLDWAGPLDALNILSHSHSLHLFTIAATLDPIPTQNHLQSAQGSLFSQSLLPTHTFATAPRDLDVLLIPGGLGSRAAGSEVYMESQVEYLRELDLSGAGSVKVCIFWLCERVWEIWADVDQVGSYGLYWERDFSADGGVGWEEGYYGMKSLCMELLCERCTDFKHGVVE
jgi:hypothetical protein